MKYVYGLIFLIISTNFAYAEDDTIKSESTVISNGTMETTINSQRYELRKTQKCKGHV